MYKVGLFLVLLISKIAWADCGTQGTLQDRIQNCNQSKKSGAYTWQLVSQSDGRESWIDDTTGTIWSDRSFGYSEPTAVN